LDWRRRAVQWHAVVSAQHAQPARVRSLTCLMFRVELYLLQLLDEEGQEEAGSVEGKGSRRKALWHMVCHTNMLFIIGTGGLLLS